MLNIRLKLRYPKYCLNNSSSLFESNYNQPSASIISKLSQSGIGLAHLELALERDSVNGIKLLLKEPNGAYKYRITNNNMAIAKITSYIQKHQTSIKK